MRADHHSTLTAARERRYRQWLYSRPNNWGIECAMEAKRVPAYPVPEDHRFPPRLLDPPATQPAAPCAWAGPVTVACVLRVSHDFGPREVNLLRRAVARNLVRPHRFVCLTDYAGPGLDQGVEVVPLRHPDWVTKHSKLELFRIDLLNDWGRTIYVDLDTVICGSLEDLASYDGGFAMLRDFYLSRMNGSGLMVWGECLQLSMIYEHFLALTPAERMERYPIGGGRGDQLFIRHHTPVAPHQLQDCWPGQIGSYKAHFRGRGKPKPKFLPRVVCFHGRPKPPEVHDWVRDYYDGEGLGT